MRILGITPPASWLATIGFALSGLILMLIYSPVADRIAARWVAARPKLDAFRGLQQSRVKLVIGIVLAWVLGAFLEELILRGVILRFVEARVSVWLAAPAAAGAAIVVAALAAGIAHLYQGLRATIIVGQLSILFGVLFVASGHNLWAVMLCHGLYDTIAFIRFAHRKSKYSKLEAN